MRVLHVAEAFGGGIAVAIEQYHCFPEAEHWLLARVRSADVNAGDLPTGPRVRLVPDVWSLVQRWLAVREQRYDVVHAHSSLAGVLVRTLPPRHAAVVYSPHALASLNHENPRVRRMAQMVERLLVARTDAFGAVSAAERSELSRLDTHRRIPNVVVPHAVAPVMPVCRADERSPRVVAAGRLGYQKNPELVAGIPRRIPVVGGRPVAWVWLGDGDDERRKLLTRGGWQVTGWQPRRAVLAELSHAAVLIHPARYEGMPLAVMEAMAAGTPVVAADIPALSELHSVQKFAHYEEAVDQVRRLLRDPLLRQEVSDSEIQEVLDLASRDTQDLALDYLYSVSGRRSA